MCLSYFDGASGKSITESDHGAMVAIARARSIIAETERTLLACHEHDPEARRLIIDFAANALNAIGLEFRGGG